MQGRSINWPDEAIQWMKAAPRTWSVTQMRAGLAAFFPEVPSLSAVRYFMRRHAPRVHGGKGLKTSVWATPEVAEALRPEWHKGTSTPGLADIVTQMTGEFPSSKSVSAYCLRVFGQRQVLVASGRHSSCPSPAEKRERRCLRCGHRKMIARPMFICDECHSVRADLGLVETYELVGARIV